MGVFVYICECEYQRVKEFSDPKNKSCNYI